MRKILLFLPALLIFLAGCFFFPYGGGGGGAVTGPQCNADTYSATVPLVKCSDAATEVLVCQHLCPLGGCDESNPGTYEWALQTDCSQTANPFCYEGSCVSCVPVCNYADACDEGPMPDSCGGFCTRNTDGAACSAMVGETGKLTGVNGNWQTVTLTNTYTNPVVIAKPASFNGGAPAHTRIRNVQPNSFDIRMEEWDYDDDAHGGETVSYFVMESGSYDLSGIKIEAGKKQNVNLAANTASTKATWHDVTFAQSFASPPAVFTQVQTYNDNEKLYDFTGTAIDTTKWTALPGVSGAVAQNNKVELDVTSPSPGTWRSADLHSKDKIILRGDFDIQADFSGWAHTGTNGDTQARFMVLTQADAFTTSRTGFFISVQSGTGTPALYRQEYINNGLWLVGQYVTADASDNSGKLRITRTGCNFRVFYWKNSQWNMLGANPVCQKPTNYPNGVTGDMFIVLESTTNAGTMSVDFDNVVIREDAVTTRVKDLTSSGFKVTLQEEESHHIDTTNIHLAEDVGYIALSTVTNPDSIIGKTSAIFNHNWVTLNFGQTLSKTPDIFIADMETSYGLDTANVRYQNLGASSVEIITQEEISYDSETDHANEALSYLIAENAGPIGTNACYGGSCSGSS